MWTGDSVSGSTTSSIIVAPAASTTYAVACSNGVDEVLAGAKVTVTAAPGLTLTASPSQTVTSGSSLSLTASGCSMGTIRWSNGQITNRILIIPMASSSVYSATCTVSSTCKATASIVVSTTPAAAQAIRY